MAKIFCRKQFKTALYPNLEPVTRAKNINKDRYSGANLPVLKFKGKLEDGIELETVVSDRGEYLDWGETGLDVKINLKDCDLKYSYNGELGKDAYIKLGDFSFSTYTRQANHIVSLLDKWTIEDRIKKDDLSVIDLLDDTTAAQLEKYTNIAIENNAKNLTAKLLELKKERFPEWGGTEEFTLEE